MIRTRDLFLDIDGVFADFDGAYESHFGVRPTGRLDVTDEELWHNIRTHHAGRWFRDLLLTPDALLLWDTFQRYNPTFLTGVSLTKYPTGREEKHEWVQRHFRTERIIVCESKDKHCHGRPGDVLVDDRTKYRSEWEQMGGVFVLHRTAGETIAQVEALMR